MKKIMAPDLEQPERIKPMAKISIEEIQQVISADGWTLISDTYKNLDSNLEFRCAAGHAVVAPYKKIRQQRICPTCMREHLKTKEFKNQKKKQGDYRILALDQATHVSGYAVFNNKNLIAYGSFTAAGRTDIERAVDVKHWMISLIDQYEVDFIGLEGIQYQSTIGVTAFESLARLQGVLAATCIEEKIPYKIIHSNTWRERCGVKGKTRPDRKRSMQRLVKEWFGLDLTEDECDAVGIAKYCSDTQTPKVEVVDWEND